MLLKQKKEKNRISHTYQLVHSVTSSMHCIMSIIYRVIQKNGYPVLFFGITSVIQHRF